jgi:hypothetical protein
MPDLGHRTGDRKWSLQWCRTGSEGDVEVSCPSIRTFTQLAVDSTGSDRSVHMQLLGRELREVLGSSRQSRLKLVNEGSALQKVG